MSFLKTCTKCKNTLESSLFALKKASKDGLHSWCSACKNGDRKNYSRSSTYRERNLEYYYRNKDKWKAIKARRRARELQSLPDWLTEEDKWMMDEVYSLATLRTVKTNVTWEVDHIIPLQGEKVCGLHVPLNLQVLTMLDNRSKSNKYVVI